MLVWSRCFQLVVRGQGPRPEVIDLIVEIVRSRRVLAVAIAARNVVMAVAVVVTAVVEGGVDADDHAAQHVARFRLHVLALLALFAGVVGERERDEQEHLRRHRSVLRVHFPELLIDQTRELGHLLGGGRGVNLVGGSPDVQGERRAFHVSVVASSTSPKHRATAPRPREDSPRRSVSERGTLPRMLDLPTAIPLPPNEPVLAYAPGSPERASVKKRLDELLNERPELPHVIGGQRVFEGAKRDIVAPHRRHHVLAQSSDATPAVTSRAIQAARDAASGWAETPFEERARIFLKAADLLAGPRRSTLVAATMLGQSKTVYQSEIDAACELIDFLRFNVAYASRLLEQPSSPAGVRNMLEARPLEGFVLAVTPFNFTAIAGNLPFAPALLGNVVVWKCAETQGLAAHHTMRLFEEAGLPPGVINLLYGPGAPVADTCLAARDLAGVHFTGSTGVFQRLWRGVGERIDRYRSYPRLVGETGGKDFVLAHPSADEDSLVTALVRGAFEYQGQKCSAASRAYLPRSIFQRIEARLVEETKALRMGDVVDFQHFLGAVIDERAFARHARALDDAKNDPACRVLVGGTVDDREGYFVSPTIIVVNKPDHPLMTTELFGPILTVFVYDDDRVEETATLVDETSPYALTGAIFSQDRAALARLVRRLRQSAGNLYLNDKPTGAVVGQQPFGGARGSGTNDKAGSALNLLRWCSPRTIKETWVPPTAVGYPHQKPDDDKI